MNLEEIRLKIDSIDKELSALLEERFNIVKHVAQFKIKNNIRVRDKAREQSVIDKAVAALNDRSLAQYIQQAYQSIIDASSRMQQDMIASGRTADQTPATPEPSERVGYMGVPGSFSEQSVMNYYGQDTERRGYPLFADVVDALLAGEIASAMLPIENSSTGCINAVVDLIRENDVPIVGEQIVRVKHNLLGLPGSKPDDITTVYSHPQGLEQCSRYLRSKGYTALTSLNTAVAAEQVSKSGDHSIAAIASSRAAELYGLEILAADIQDNDFNFTRFVVLKVDQVIPQDADKISLVFALDHRPGTLYEALKSFAEAGINLTSLESRPIWAQAWHYFFHLDITGRLDDQNVKSAIERLSANCSYIKVLGNYRASTPEVF